MLKASGAVFFLASRKQCDTLRFWIYFVGSNIEAKNYLYTLSISDKTGEEKYIFQGKVFTLDKDDPHGKFLLSWNETKIFANIWLDAMHRGVMWIHLSGL